MSEHEARRMSEEDCEWQEEDGGGPWESWCGHLFEFNSDGPKENGFRFCPYCGKRLVAVFYKDGAGSAALAALDQEKP